MKKSRKVIAFAMSLTLAFGGFAIPEVTNVHVVNTIEVSAATNTNQIESLISVAESQIGYREGSNNYTKYGVWYGIPNGAWCAMYVSWCATQAGISTQIVSKHADCDSGKNWFMNKGLWKNSKYQGGAYTPKRGDIIYFSGKYTLKDSTHVGIVYNVSGNTVYTIEGNTADQCAKRSYSLSSSYIIGYGTPDFVCVPEK